MSRNPYTIYTILLHKKGSIKRVHTANSCSILSTVKFKGLPYSHPDTYQSFLIPWAMINGLNAEYKKGELRAVL